MAFAPLPILHAVRETTIVIAGLGCILLASWRSAKKGELLPPETTSELKGLAILMVILSHIGLFLFSDQRFLAPLSYYAGVGVDIFFILSGYGLTVSALRQPLSRLDFYRKRLSKIYIPVLATVLIFLALDAILLFSKTYPLTTTIANLFGLFPHADLFNDLNSPLWFITLLLIYYAAFPLIFIRRAPWISGIILVLVAAILLIFDLPEKYVTGFTLTWLYKLHMFAFPLGMCLANFLPRLQAYFLSRSYFRVYTSATVKALLQTCVLGVFLNIILFAHYHPTVGKSWVAEELASLGIALSFIAIWALKPGEFRALKLYGKYSFEVYLIHWPLLYRYGSFYGHLPPSLATLLYLAVFIGLAYGYRQGLAWLTNQGARALAAGRRLVTSHITYEP